MAKNPVLVVMAAGMGSRYGGLKQIDPVGSHGEAILDFSIYDAYEAGFRTAVIIIKEAIKKDFMETVGARLAKSPMEIRYAYQELDKLPAGYTVPEGRTKPWGTSHAVLCGKDAIDGAPFAVVNADDYYGKETFKAVFAQLSATEDPCGHCMVGFELQKTVTNNGSVARGVCVTDGNGNLATVTERTSIEKYEGGIRYSDNGQWVDVAPETIVSMNIWGFMPSFLEEIEARFPAFLDKALVENPAKGEFYLPSVVSALINEGKASVKVLSTTEQWYGVTYAADKPMVMAALKAMTDAGKYPDGLWG